MWAFMRSNPIYLPNTTQTGLSLVKQGGYAFLLESTTNEYFRNRDCSLMQVGDLLDTKSYGLGLKKNSIWRERISNGIIFLQENGNIPRYYDKWWKVMSRCFN
jgi:ABC-type amino acid transport substrate-binding protein